MNSSFPPDPNTQPAPQPVRKSQARIPVAKAPVSKPVRAALASQQPFDDRARPVSFYFARWGVTADGTFF